MTKNRPQSGSLPLRKDIVSNKGHTKFIHQTWYDGLELKGNTSINPFFYGTFLGETKPNEPVTRTKKQAYQADAVGAAHQLTASHFLRPHTFRLEWQPGPGGRLDWFVKGYRVNETFVMEGDGDGQDWNHAYSLKDDSLKNLMGSQIPMEPSYLILNTAISSTWGFPYDTPDWCPKCYDCDDPACACSFYPGFCQMIESKVTMYIDSIRVYQSQNASAHVGVNHTLGCDPPEFPTRDWIQGHAYRYSRNPPFSYEDKGPLRKIQHGGANCRTDADCGANVTAENITAIYENQLATARQLEKDANSNSQGRGRCVTALSKGMFTSSRSGRVCECFQGFTGPHCLAIAHVDETPSASELRRGDSPFHTISKFHVPFFMLASVATLAALLVAFLSMRVLEEKKARLPKPALIQIQKSDFPPHGAATIITGTSI